MALEFDLYEGVFYCVSCNCGAHLIKLVKSNYTCAECGGRSHITHVDYNLKGIMTGERIYEQNSS